MPPPTPPPLPQAETAPDPSLPPSAADALVRALVEHGVDTVFGIPGTHNIPIYGALERHGVRHVLMRHEQGCAYAADGYARSSGRPGVVVTTTGPALLNAAAALGQSRSDAVPVLLVAPGMATDHSGLGDGELHEMRSQLETMRTVAKAAYRASGVADVPALVAACFVEMRTGRPGPAFLEIPRDLLDLRAPAPAAPPVPVGPPAADERAVAEAAQALAAARRPLVVAGGGARGARDPLVELAARLGAPVVTTFNGKGTFPESDRLSAWTGLGRAAVHRAMASADLILAVGTELAPSDLWHGSVPDVPLIRIDVDPVMTLRPVPCAVGIVGDAEASLRAVVSALSALPAGRGVDGAWTAGVVADARAESAATARPWEHLVAGLGAAIDEGRRLDGRATVIAGDSTMACYYGLGPALPLERPHDYLYPTGFGTLGYGLPAGIGAALARPESRVVVVEGDGGLMFSVNELASASHLRLPLPVVVVVNDGYGEIRRQMQESLSLRLGVDFPPPNLTALAEAFGCRHRGADDAASIAAAVRAAWDADAPTIIEVPEGDPRP